MPNPNPNRSGLKNFAKGKSGNPGGKTKETVSIERSNAEKALKLRAMGLDALLDVIENAGDEEKTSSAIATLLNTNTLKMLKDAEDRGLGAPVQFHDVSTTEKPTTINLKAPDDGSVD